MAESWYEVIYLQKRNKSLFDSSASKEFNHAVACHRFSLLMSTLFALKK